MKLVLNCCGVDGLYMFCTRAGHMPTVLIHAAADGPEHVTQFITTGMRILLDAIVPLDFTKLTWLYESLGRHHLVPGKLDIVRNA